MNQPTQTQANVAPFVATLYRLLTYVEICALIGAAIGFAMLYVAMEGALEILNVALSILAMVFFLKGYEKRPEPELKEGEPKAGFVDLLATRIIPKTGWIACAVTTVAILFTILNLKGKDEMLMIGCATLTAALVLVGLFIVTKPDRAIALMPLVYRAAPLWLVGAYLFMSRLG
jgi:hypothetical protein